MYSLSFASEGKSMATLDRDGVRIYYETHGSGPALLLTHGYSATSQMWRPQIDALSRDHTLILWDMRGHGQSDSPADDGLYSEALTTQDMAALVQSRPSIPQLETVTRRAAAASPITDRLHVDFESPFSRVSCSRPPIW